VPILIDRRQKLTPKSQKRGAKNSNNSFEIKNFASDKSLAEKAVYVNKQKEIKLY